MRYVLVPDDVTLLDPLTGKRLMRAPDVPEEPISMIKFLNTTILPDQKFGKGFEALRTADKIQKAFEDVKPGDVAELEDADYKILMDVIRNPSGSFNPIIARQYIPFMKALDDAPEDRSKLIKSVDKDVTKVE